GLDRSDRGHHRSIFGRLESRSLHLDRRDGDQHDTRHTATLALGFGAHPADRRRERAFGARGGAGERVRANSRTATDRCGRQRRRQTRFIFGRAVCGRAQGNDHSGRVRPRQQAAYAAAARHIGRAGESVARGAQTGEQLTQTLNILMPATGTDYSRRAAEVAITLAKASGASVTALHIAPPPEETDLLRRPRELLRTGRALLRDIGALGKREG